MVDFEVFDVGSKEELEVQLEFYRLLSDHRLDTIKRLESLIEKQDKELRKR